MPIFAKIDPLKIASHSESISSPKVIPPQKSVVAEPVNHSPSARKMVGRGIFSTPSILDALKEDIKEDQSPADIEDSENQVEKNGSFLPFTEKELLEAWKIFVGKIDFPQLKSALSAREPRLADGWKIEYELDTELQFNRLTLDLKPKILGYLRHFFQNEAIEIVFSVSAENSTHHHVPYTDAERWTLLVEKYPALATLKSKFGLDFEHF